MPYVLGLIDVGKWILTGLQMIALWFDWIVYELLTYAYMLFAVMCKLNFSSLEVVLSSIVMRIQVLFGVVMLFIVAFNLLTFLIDPSDGKLKNNNIGMKIVVSIALLVASNFAFGLLDSLQNAIVDQNVIEKIIMGSDDATSYNINNDSGARATYEKYTAAGRFISYNLFFSFYVANRDEPNIKNDIISGTAKFHRIVEKSTDNIDYEYPVISTLCGILVIVMYVTFAIDIGIRAFNLLILRIVMPVAALGYLIPKQGEKILKNYVSVYMKTYAQLFAKIFMSYLIVYLMMALMSLLLTQAANDIISGDIINTFNNQNFLGAFPIFFKVILLILVLVSLYLFYKQLPKIVGQILGVKIESGKGLVAKTFGILGAAGTLAMAPVGLAKGAAAGIRGKAGVAGTAKTALHGMNNRLGKGLTKLGNATIGENGTKYIKNAIDGSKAERANLDKYANDNMSERQKVKNQEREKAQKQSPNSKALHDKYQDKFEKKYHVANDTENTNTEPIQDETPQRTITPEQQEQQRQLKETLKTKHQTAADDEMRNRGEGSMGPDGHMQEAASSNGAAPSSAENSGFASVTDEELDEYINRQSAKETQERLDDIDMPIPGDKVAERIGADKEQEEILDINEEDDVSQNGFE